MQQESPAMTPQQKALTSTGHAGIVKKYRQLVCAKGSGVYFFYYELVTTLLGNLPGIIGLALRSVAYPSLFAIRQGKVAVGKGVTLRNPLAIKLGKGVLLDDWSVLDARGDSADVELSDAVTVGRFTSIVAKDATIYFGPAVNIGSYCRIATQSKILIGESTLIGAYCYIGPGNHQQGDELSPLIERPMDIRGGVSIGKHCWLGARVTVLDGVTIGDGAIIGAHSLVKDDVPAGAVAVGVPAKIIRRR